MTKPGFDHVIAGGGSAACVAAMRLVRKHGMRVLLVERGPKRYHWLMRMPAGYMKFLGREDFLAMHETAAQERLGGRAPIVPQARVLGGCSSVNAMIYVRGQPEDYDRWNAFLGLNGGWAYADMLPHFRALKRNSKFNSRFHGIDGGLMVSDPGRFSDTTEDFMLAAQGCGIPLDPNFNGEIQSGVGVVQHTMGRVNGRLERCDAVCAFLRQVEGDPRLTSRLTPRLTVVTDALASRACRCSRVVSIVLQTVVERRIRRQSPTRRRRGRKAFGELRGNG